MSDYVMVPVPESLVIPVMRLIAEHDSADERLRGRGSARVVDHDDTEAEDSREWTLEEFEVLRSGEAKSIKLFCQVLDVLAAASPSAVALEDVAKVTGVEPLTMQRAFGRATVWMKNRMGGDTRWPIFWPGDGWAMSETNASLWKSLAE
ncbi:hypothetical protein [Rathayibacter sp. AY1C1]|uniref:hypothetical protein n=1 Tax=Rathayibacter sp. AY1C1 TaxID=2080534 RepID=UPI0011AFDA99|nr:hypothetical protein [Rathayibacter sp. AY1C1]